MLLFWEDATVAPTLLLLLLLLLLDALEVEEGERGVVPAGAVLLRGEELEEAVDDECAAAADDVGVDFALSCDGIEDEEGEEDEEKAEREVENELFPLFLLLILLSASLAEGENDTVREDAPVTSPFCAAVE